jgi:large subunit ribosomal protein L14
MIQKGTFLTVIDNSGAKSVCCIRIVGGHKKRYAYLGDTLIVSIKSLRNKRRSALKIKKGDVVRAAIVRTKKSICSYTGNSISFKENSVVLISKQNKILGTRVFGSLPRQLNYTKLLKFVSISSGFCF